jgi:diguanylate cyclase (GGDEF)-like protein
MTTVFGRRLGVRSLQAVTGLLVAIYLASTLLRRDHTTSTLYDGWIGNLGYVGCALLCAWRALVVRRQRLAWAAIALSLVLFTAGAVLWTTVVQFFDPVPYPSVADGFFLVFYPLAFLGVGLLIRDSLPRSSRSIWLDGLIAALGVAALEATVVIAPISHGTLGEAVTVVTTLAYPVGDLVLVGMVVAVFAMRGWQPGRVWWTLGAGLAVFAVADSVYVLRVTANTYVTGTWLDSLWLIGTFLVATAAWIRPEPAEETVRSQPLVVPGLFLLSSLGIVVYATSTPVLPLGVVLATGTLLVAIIRMAHSYGQLRTLAESRREARTDELTGLPNRRLFYETVGRCFEGGSGREQLAVLMVDLDRFKEINDSLGHHVGDDILRQLGPRLAGVVGGAGTVARLGGDEFGLLLSPITDPTEATDLADQVCEVLRAPFELETMTLHVDASIGIALAPDHGTEADTLLQKADVAMYEAKRSRRSWALYSPERDTNTRDRLELMEDLRDAIDGDQLILHYQPKVDLASNTMTGVEALVRWEHPTRGLLAPDRFLDLAEQSGLIEPLAMVVLDQALAQQAQWARDGLPLTVAVNLSAVNLRDEHLDSKVAGLLSHHGVAPASLILELTEQSIMADPEQNRGVLERLRSLGVAISIDDYGTGFSSLAYLRELPVSELKLDRTFLAGVPHDARAVAIVRSTVELAHSLGLRMVAEGVESVDALALLGDLGCDIAQGYLLGRPVPPCEIRPPAPGSFTLPADQNTQRSRRRTLPSAVRGMASTSSMS